MSQQLITLGCPWNVTQALVTQSFMGALLEDSQVDDKPV